MLLIVKTRTKTKNINPNQNKYKNINSNQNKYKNINPNQNKNNTQNNKNPEGIENTQEHIQVVKKPFKNQKPTNNLNANKKA